MTDADKVKKKKQNCEIRSDKIWVQPYMGMTITDILKKKNIEYQ